MVSTYQLFCSVVYSIYMSRVNTLTEKIVVIFMRVCSLNESESSRGHDVGPKYRTRQIVYT